MIDAEIVHVPCKGLYDSGAQVSTISRTFLNTLKEKKGTYDKFNVSEPHFTLEFANGTRERCATVKLVVTIGNHKDQKFVFVVVENSKTDVIFGLDAIRKFNINLPVLTNKMVRITLDKFRVGNRWQRFCKKNVLILV